VFEVSPDPKVIARLLELARQDPVMRVRAQAVRGLPGSNPDAISICLAGIHSVDADMRRWCAVSLGIYKPPGAREAMSAQAEHETDPEVKQELTRYLSESNWP
jgi:hypothetical protein